MSAFRPRVLVIDDEPQIHRFLGPALDAAGYEVERADDAGQGLKAIASRPPDAVVLDLGLPDMDGKVALQKARTFYDGPILILSARDREIEKIQALDLGADDYVEKPFSVGELLARLRVALRHKVQKAGGEPRIKAGDLEIDLPLRMVTVKGEQVRLSPKEYELLSYGISWRSIRPRPSSSPRSLVSAIGSMETEHPTRKRKWHGRSMRLMQMGRIWRRSPWPKFQLGAIYQTSFCAMKRGRTSSASAC